MDDAIGKDITVSKPRRLPSGSWHVRWIDHAGVRKSATFSTLDAARAALRRRGTEVDDIKAGRKDPGSDRTFAEVADAFLASRRNRDARRLAQRIAAYRSHLDHHLRPVLGALRVYEIDADTIDALIVKLTTTTTARPGEKNAAGRTLTAATIRAIVTTFRVIMKYARRSVSVTLPRHLMPVPAAKPECIPTAPDVEKYLAECKPEWFRVASAISIYTGQRRGEIASLRWSAVDFADEQVAVLSSWDGPPKNDRPRFDPLPPELAIILGRWRLATGAASDGYVVTIDGRPMVEKNNPCAKLTRAACRRAGITPVRFHDLRSTFITHAADAGMPIGQLMALAGHASITTTARYIRSDSAVAAADPRARLSFSRPTAPVVSIAGGNVVATSGEARAAASET